MGSIRSPFHAVLGFLRPSLTSGANSGVKGQPNMSLFRSPSLCEKAYQLIYKLSADVNTSEPILRYD